MTSASLFFKAALSDGLWRVVGDLTSAVAGVASSPRNGE